MKICSTCGISKDMSSFYTDNSKSDGRRSNCKSCHNTSVALRLKDPNVKKKAYAKRAEWESKNSARRHVYKSQWLLNDAASNPEKYALKYLSYAKNNAGKINAKTRKRQAAKIQRTPNWLDVVDMSEMECIYMYAASLRKVGLKYDVDHIYPLQGKLVSGLHVPSNLRVIHESENRSKHNKFEVI